MFQSKSKLCSSFKGQKHNYFHSQSQRFFLTASGSGKAAWVRRITIKRAPAKKIKSPSIPRWLINTGFNFERVKDEKFCNVTRIPTTVDLG